MLLSSSKAEEQLEHSCIALVNFKLCSHNGKGCGNFFKNVHLQFDSEIPFLTEIKIYVQRNVYMNANSSSMHICQKLETQMPLHG